MSKIVFDLGHGGKDSGAVGNGLKEKDLVLEIGKYIKDMISEYNCEYLFTRLNDSFLTLNDRVTLSNNFKSDIFVSVHINSSTNNQARGIETYCYNKNTNNGIAETIHNSLLSNKNLYVKDRGIKESNFTVIAKTTAKACLLELGFISNSEDVKLLKKYLKEYAKAIVDGVVIHQKLEKKVSERILYQVNTGAYSNRENANNQMKQLEKDGYKPYITIIKDTI